MEEYNPNAIWKSKKKKVAYTPPEPSRVFEVTGSGQGASSSSRHQDGSWKKMAVIAIVTIIVLGAAYGVWVFATRPVPVPVVGLDFAAPSEVKVGEPFTFSVLYTNSSTVSLRNASLDVALSDGVFFSGQPASERTVTISLDDIAAGDSGKKDVTILVAQGAGSVVQVSSTLSYAIDASPGKSLSVSDKGSVAVGTPVIGLAIGAPANVFAGQDFMTEVSYKNTTNHPIDGAKVTMQYPEGFIFTHASPTPAFPGNTTWNLGPLTPGEDGTILVTGIMNGKNTALYSLSGTITEDVSGVSYAVAAGAANVAITAAPLTIGAVAGNNPDYIAKASDFLDYKVAYANMSDTTFHDVRITAALTGAMFDLGSVQSDAAFNSRTNTLTWYTANTPELAAVAAGNSGSVDFRVKTKPSFPIATAADKDFTLGAHLTISSLTVPAGTVASSTSASVDVTNKVGGMVTLDAVGYRYETGRTIMNTGPYPPKVNQPTTYTIHWRVTDYSTDVDNVSVSAYLQSGTTCTGKIVSTISAVPVCDPATGAVTWTIPKIAAGTGVLGAPVEAVFQVENMPAVNQAGQNVTLLGKTSLTATDEFTSATLSSSVNPMSTDIPEDGAVTTSDRRVTQ